VPQTDRFALAFATQSFSDPDDLSACLATSGILSDPPPVGDVQLEEASVLAMAIARAARAASHRLPVEPRDAATLNSFADEEPPRLAMRSDGTALLTAAAPLQAALSAIARAAIELIVDRATDIRICEANACGNVFLDDSRAGRRRWCSMTRCGNRAKAQAFRKRQHEVK